jgi:branched-chain amino acid transport system ATP-binding protein
MPEPLLDVAGLNAWYGESHVLHGVDLQVGRGETVTLLGRNGVGKTTTLRAIMGIVRKRTGTIRFDDQDLMRLPLHRTAHAGLGFVPEERGIFSTLSVQENLMLPPVVAGGGLSIEEIYTLFPNLKERRSSPGTKLSGGEQQMLAIARMLRTGVKMLLLDEPTEGLAPVIIDRIGEVLAELRTRGMTILLVEQNFRFAASLGDTVAVMDDGRIVHRSTMQALAADSELQTRLLGLSLAAHQ